MKWKNCKSFNASFINDIVYNSLKTLCNRTICYKSARRKEEKKNNSSFNLQLFGISRDESFPKMLADGAMADLPHPPARHLDRKSIEWSRLWKINSTYYRWVITIIIHVFDFVRPRSKRTQKVSIKKNSFCEINRKEELAFHECLSNERYSIEYVAWLLNCWTMIKWLRRLSVDAIKFNRSLL